MPSLYCVAAADRETGDLIVKIVNANASTLETELVLNGTAVTGHGTAIVLTSEKATDENSLEEPTKVSPKSPALTFSGNILRLSIPGNSLNVLRLKTR